MYANSIEVMLDAATSFHFDEQEKEKLLMAIEKTSKQLDELRQILESRSASVHSHRGGKIYKRKTLKKKK